MEADEGSYGRFTRAYLQAMTRLAAETSNGVWTALTLAMQSEKSLRALWSGWLEARLRRHVKTDADPGLTVLRYARSAERRVGNGWVRTGRYGWAPLHSKKKKKK